MALEPLTRLLWFVMSLCCIFEVLYLRFSTVRSFLTPCIYLLSHHPPGSSISPRLHCISFCS